MRKEEWGRRSDDAAAVDVQVDPQRCRFGRSQTDLALQECRPSFRRSRNESQCCCASSALRSRGGPAEEETQKLAVHVDVLVRGRVLIVSVLCAIGIDLALRSNVQSCIKVSGAAVRRWPWPTPTVCGRFIQQQTDRVWAVYYKQIRKSEQRPPLHLRAADLVPQPRTPVCHTATNRLCAKVKKIFIKKTAQSVGPRDWTEGEVRSAYRSVLNRAGALCSIAHTRGAWLPAATCRGCPGAEPMGKHRAHERACRAWSSHMRLST